MELDLYKHFICSFHFVKSILSYNSAETLTIVQQYMKMSQCEHGFEV